MKISSHAKLHQTACRCKDVVFFQNTLSAIIITHMPNQLRWGVLSAAAIDLRTIIPRKARQAATALGTPTAYASKAVLENTDVPPVLKDAIKNMAVIEAIFHTANSRQWESPKIKMKRLPCRGSGI
jgi:hypothetical protein